MKLEEDIQNIFSIPDNFDVPGIYCFLSKDKTFFYIGSSVHMKRRYNRHIFNIKDDNVRNSMASPKFYNYVDSLEKIWDGLLIFLLFIDY